MASTAPQTNASPRILIARPDRIGDVILSTPVVAALRKQYPNAHITFLVRDLVAPLIRGVAGVDAVYVYEPEGRHKGLRGFFLLMEELKAQRFQISIVLHSTLKLAAALYGVGVPNRVGSLSKLHSFFFFNRGTRQRRSLVEMHEADYNLQLLRKLGIRVPTQTIPTRVHVAESLVDWAAEWLERAGYLRDPNLRQHLIAVHPGMGGSALNWPENHYVDLIKSLDREGHRVLVTGGVAEAMLLERLQQALTDTAKPVLFYVAEPGTGVDRLAALYAHASIVVAPSTGPLHVAVALGKPVLTFYPPIRVQSAIRWGPYVKNHDDASVLVPEAYCGEDFSCRGPKCNYYPCMRSILPKQAMEEATRLLGEAAAKSTKQDEPKTAQGSEKSV